MACDDDDNDGCGFCRMRISLRLLLLLRIVAGLRRRFGGLVVGWLRGGIAVVVVDVVVVVVVVVRRAGRRVDGVCLDVGVTRMTGSTDSYSSISYEPVSMLSSASCSTDGVVGGIGVVEVVDEVGIRCFVYLYSWRMVLLAMGSGVVVVVVVFVDVVRGTSRTFVEYLGGFLLLVFVSFKPKSG